MEAKDERILEEAKSDVSIGALSEPEFYEEKIDWINNCDRAYGIMCLGMPPIIYHLIDSAEFPFELWKIL